MAVDTPATIAIIGAGPIGLEAALYGRFLGYDVLLFDRGEVAAEVQRSGHSPLNAPFGGCTSKLGLAALHAQHPAWKPPPPDAQLTGHAWRTVYLLPLAHSDLLVDGLHEYSEVTSVERVRANEHSPDEAGDEDQSEFRLQVRSAHPHGSTKNQEFLAQVVIDASGSSRPPVGAGGIAAPAAAISGLPSTARPIAKLSKDATEQERILSSLATLGVLTSEPDFYLLGSKTSASASELLTVSTGLDQIRALYTIIGDRSTLDLYATMTNLLP